MVQTAFQPDAFQNNAFQILVGGGEGKSPSRRIRVFLTEEDEEIDKLKEDYESIVEQIHDESFQKELLVAVDPYIAPLTKEELERRLNAALMLKAPPSVSRIDFDNLYLNLIARMRFIKTLEHIKARLMLFKQKQEEEAAIMLLLLGI